VTSDISGTVGLLCSVIEQHYAHGVCGHVSSAMREELRAALQARWEESLRQRARLATRSAVSLLGGLLAGVRPADSPVRSHLAPKVRHWGGETRAAADWMPCDLRFRGRAAQWTGTVGASTLREPTIA
jgi:hypothetical protein